MTTWTRAEAVGIVGVGVMGGGMAANILARGHALAAYDKSLEFSPDEPAALTGRGHIDALAAQGFDARWAAGARA